MWPSPCSAYWISWLTPTGRPPHTCEGGFNSCMIMNENSRWDSKFQLRVRGQFPWTFKLSNPCSYQGDRSVAHPCSSLILCWPLILLDEDAVVTMCLVLGGATLIVAVFFLFLLLLVLVVMIVIMMMTMRMKLRITMAMTIIEDIRIKSVVVVTNSIDQLKPSISVN